MRVKRYETMTFIKKILILFKGFVYVAVTDSYTSHQDFVSPFSFVFWRLLNLNLEHDLEEISNVSEELDPGGTWGREREGS